ncbi:hypothetical protein KKF84_03115 [Myxococcota bacterium]|nr:hypothetical protein [Myxococcota bacterium]MBU1534280.1 hypothetical protein [Myxococcota bacterium]
MLLLLFFFGMAGCEQNNERGKVLPVVFPSTVSLTSTGRIFHEITGPDWETPNIPVGDVVFVGDNGELDSFNRFFTEGLDEPAAFVSGTTVNIAVHLKALSGTWFAGRISLSATWQPLIISDGSAAVVASRMIDVSRLTDDGTDVIMSTVSLPSTVDIMELEIRYSLDGTAFKESEGSNHLVNQVFTTNHLLPLSLRQPISGTPVYGQSMLWASEWAAGLRDIAAAEEDEEPNRSQSTEEEEDTFGDEGLELEHQVALRMMHGVYGLSSEGKSYGPFPRPLEKDNRAHVYIDFPRSACSEYRGILMSLIEYHGVDAQWKSIAFLNPSSTWYSMYETIPIAASGREVQVWRHINHVFVQVNGQIYDAVYDLHSPNFSTYEDTLFASYCFGEDEACDTPDGWCNNPRPADRPCVENPPGLDPSLGMTIGEGEIY